MERRRFVRLVGGGVVMAAATTSLSGCAGFGVPPSAVAAWKGPGTDADLRRWALSHAILAPNPHNMQPWLADLRVPGEITLSLDTQRLLPATDPHGRQILMGAGAFLELLVMAAAQRGHRADIALFPDGEPGATLDARPFARIRLMADAAASRDPLFANVFVRRTDRRGYDPGRAIAAADAARLSAAVTGLPVRFGLAGRVDSAAADANRVESIRAIAREAWRIEFTTEAPMMESLRVLRVGSDEIDRYRDGISLTRPLAVMLVKAGLFDRTRFPAPDSKATRDAIRDFDAITASTPAYLWIVTEGNARAQQIMAGRAYVRLNLAGAGAGLAMHPNEQALQEYPEVARPYQAIHALLDAPAPRYTVQMLARVGYPLPRAGVLPPAPRRGVDTLITA